MLKADDVFFPNPDSRNNLPVPPPDGFKESYQQEMPPQLEEKPDPALVKHYSTWGPSGLQRNPLQIPLWPVFVGIALFLGLQTVYSVIFLILRIANNPDLLQNGTVTTDNITESGILTPALVVGSLILGWIGLLSAVYLAGRKYPGGWKDLILWKFSWTKDIIIAFVFTVFVRLVEIGLGLFLDSYGINQEELSNSQILTQFTGVTFLAIIVGAGLIAPIVEEVFFRGMFLRSVLDKVWLANADKDGKKVKSSNFIVATLVGFVVYIFVFILTTFASSSFAENTNGEGTAGGLPSVLTIILPVAAGLLSGFLYWNLPSARSKSATAGLLFSSLVFGILHTQATGASSLYTVGFTTLIGFGLGVLFLVTGRLGTAVLAHVFLNSSAVVLLLFTGLPT